MLRPATNPFTIFLQNQMARKAHENFLGTIVYQASMYLRKAEDKANASEEITQSLREDIYIPHGASVEGVLTLIAKRYRQGVDNIKTRKDEEFSDAA